MQSKKEAETITEIDKDNLDVECVNLPSAYRQYAFMAAEAKRDVQEAKAQLDVTQAELSRDARAKPHLFGLEKVTETALTGAVLCSKRFPQDQKALLKAQHAYEMCNAVVWALEHKKRALTLLVELHGMGYFGEVRTSPEGKQAIEQMMQAKVRRRRRQSEDV